MNRSTLTPRISPPAAHRPLPLRNPLGVLLPQDRLLPLRRESEH
jgi:hypothetical protein